MTQSISPYLYNTLQIQPQILVQITSNNYAAELQKFFFSSYVRFTLIPRYIAVCEKGRSCLGLFYEEPKFCSMSFILIHSFIYFTK